MKGGSRRGNGSESNFGSENEQESLQQVLARGEQAAQLLQNPVFNLAYQAQMENIREQWLTSDPKHHNFREGLFHQARGLMDMTQNMAAWVSQAQQILQNQGSEADPEKRQADYLNTQGFGLDHVN